MDTSKTVVRLGDRRWSSSSAAAAAGVNAEGHVLVMDSWRWEGWIDRLWLALKKKKKQKEEKEKEKKDKKVVQCEPWVTAKT